MLTQHFCSQQLHLCQRHWHRGQCKFNETILFPFGLAGSIAESPHPFRFTAGTLVLKPKKER